METYCYKCSDYKVKAFFSRGSSGHKSDMAFSSLRLAKTGKYKTQELNISQQTTLLYKKKKNKSHLHKVVALNADWAQKLIFQGISQKYWTNSMQIDKKKGFLKYRRVDKSWHVQEPQTKARAFQIVHQELLSK